MARQTIRILHNPLYDEFEEIYCICGKQLVECAVFGKSCLTEKKNKTEA